MDDIAVFEKSTCLHSFYLFITGKTDNTTDVSVITTPPLIFQKKNIDKKSTARVHV